MLHVFYQDVAYILQWLFERFQVFLQVFQTYVASVLAVLERMLQMFHLDVSKVDVCCISLLAFCYLASVSPPLFDAGDVRATEGRTAWNVLSIHYVRKWLQYQR
jgi:ABC-type proline/glycine betaine transport system permease subunit